MELKYYRSEYMSQTNGKRICQKTYILPSNLVIVNKYVVQYFREQIAPKCKKSERVK